MSKHRKFCSLCNSYMGCEQEIVPGRSLPCCNTCFRRVIFVILVLLIFVIEFIIIVIVRAIQ